MTTKTDKPPIVLVMQVLVQLSGYRPAPPFDNSKHREQLRRQAVAAGDLEDNQGKVKPMRMDVPMGEVRMVKVLDRGFVRLVDFMGDDLSIVRAARVSYDAAWRAGEDEGSDKRLIRYLLKNRHTSPFEAVTLTFEVKAPIFVFRQWHRHRTWSYSEISARYSELPSEFYFPKPEMIGNQSAKNKQARSLELPEGDHTAFMDGRRRDLVWLTEHCQQAHDLYLDLLSNGWPRELARMVLPLNVYSHMFASVNLHNLFHFLELRLHQHAQYEIRVFAQAMYVLVREVVPVAAAAWADLHPHLLQGQKTHGQTTETAASTTDQQSANPPAADEAQEPRS